MRSRGPYTGFRSPRHLTVGLHVRAPLSLVICHAHECSVHLSIVGTIASESPPRRLSRHLGKRKRVPHMLLLYSVTASPYTKLPMLLPHEEIDCCCRLSRLVRQSWQPAVTKRTCCADPLDATASGSRINASLLSLVGIKAAWWFTRSSSKFSAIIWLVMCVST